MNATRIFTLLALAILGLVVGACVSVATTDVKPTVVSTPPVRSASSTPVTTDVKPTVVIAPSESASPAPATTASATPTGAAAEIDCMGACHEPDINDLLGAGAKPQPPSHKEYTTCLECHAKLTKPALPATHAGRLDAACSVCHLVK